MKIKPNIISYVNGYIPPPEFQYSKISRDEQKKKKQNKLVWKFQPSFLPPLIRALPMIAYESPAWSGSGKIALENPL